jgi:hypothetical protein
MNKAAAGWGLVLGCGGGILLAAFYLPLFGFLVGYTVQLANAVPLWVNGVVSGGVVGMSAGLAVGATVTAHQPVFRSTMTGALIGLLAALPCVVALGGLWMILVGFFGEGAGEYFQPGWGSAVPVALGWMMLVGPLLAVLGSVVGGTVACCTRAT